MVVTLNTWTPLSRVNPLCSARACDLRWGILDGKASWLWCPICPVLPSRGSRLCQWRLLRQKPRAASPFGLHAASRRTRRWADGESRKVEWQMIADEDDW